MAWRESPALRYCGKVVTPVGTCLMQGVAIEPDWPELLFLCAALTKADTEKTLDVLNDSIKYVKGGSAVNR
jgi:hypothetical protein